MLISSVDDVKVEAASRSTLLMMDRSALEGTGRKNDMDSYYELARMYWPEESEVTKDSARLDCAVFIHIAA